MAADAVGQRSVPDFFKLEPLAAKQRPVRRQKQRAARPVRRCAQSSRAERPKLHAFGYMDFSHTVSEHISERAMALLTAHRKRVPHASRTTMDCERAHLIRLARECEEKGCPPSHSPLVDLWNRKMIPPSYLPLMNRDAPHLSFTELRTAVDSGALPDSMRKDAGGVPAIEDRPEYARATDAERQRALRLTPAQVFGERYYAASPAASPRDPLDESALMSFFMTQQVPELNPKVRSVKAAHHELSTVVPLPRRKRQRINYPAPLTHLREPLRPSSPQLAEQAAAPAEEAFVFEPKTPVFGHQFAVGQAVRFRDTPDEEWREGCVVALDVRGNPLIPVQQQGSVYTWQFVEPLVDEKALRKGRRSTLPDHVRAAVRRARLSVSSYKQSPEAAAVEPPEQRRASSARPAASARSPRGRRRPWCPESVPPVSPQHAERLAQLSKPPRWWASCGKLGTPLPRGPFLQQYLREQRSAAAQRAEEKKLCRRVPLKVFLHTEQFS
eukprot:TRINITY_DN11681_c0_g1_i1.p1 TRINITY_DN11681_c0_g1~~TRINITY_DN11681_c0_g1_i1.p1  ORF type:complete len:520 (+),score=177.95 TRINITY_DN11681_c0_g1_i1:69-1562(+)